MQYRYGFRRVRDAQKAEIEAAGAHDGDVVGLYGVLTGRTEVRGEQERGTIAQCGEDACQGGEELDVGIEIEDPRVAALFDQVEKHKWLESGVELHDVVAEGEVRKIRDR